VKALDSLYRARSSGYYSNKVTIETSGPEAEVICVYVAFCTVSIPIDFSGITDNEYS